MELKRRKQKYLKNIKINKIKPQELIPNNAIFRPYNL